MDTPQPTSDERIQAAAAHLLGLVAALLFYMFRKDQSPFVRFHSLQAMAFDVVVMLAGMVFGACTGVTFAFIVPAGFLYLAERGGAPEVLVFFPFVLFAGIFMLVLPMTLASLGLRLWAAIRIVRGGDFHYPWLGARVQKFLES